MISLIIAGGMSIATTMKPVEWPDINNHTLKGQIILTSRVVCRDRWGTPMLPDGKGGYSLIQPINDKYIAESLIIPPWNIPPGTPEREVLYRPLPPVSISIEPTVAPAPAPAPASDVSTLSPVEPPMPMPSTDEAPAPDASATGDAPATQ